MTLHDYLLISEKRCRECFEKIALDNIKPCELRCGTIEYFKRGGKRLRPAILMLSAGVTGGKKAEEASVKAACAVELFHTFTLIHDDIIDNDPTRRGGKSVHVLVSDMFSSEASREKCDEYGRDTAILAGDMLHALSVRLMLEASEKAEFSPSTVIAITKMLEGECIAGVLEGEAIDTREGLIRNDSLPFSAGSFENTLNIMLKKTGYLFSYAAKAGAMLGLDTSDSKDFRVNMIGEFATLCGIAFQIQDDILGIVADEKALGKPIGSDIREGKRTVILQKAYERANARDKKIIESVVGNENITEKDVEEVKRIFNESGAIDSAKSLANDYIKRALDCLEKLPDSEYRKILTEWAYFMSERKL